MSNDKKHSRPKYSMEFKQDAARLVLEKGYSQQQAADHLGISQSSLGRWVRARKAKYLVQVRRWIASVRVSPDSARIAPPVLSNCSAEFD